MNPIPQVTKHILIINVIIWFACLASGYFNFDLSALFGLHYFESKGFYFFQLITYMFTHVDLAHIFFNMFAVFMLGSTLEQFWGSKRYLSYYLITGIGAGLIQMLVIYLRIHFLATELPAEALSLVKNEGYDLLLSRRNYVDPALGNLNLLFNTVTIGASGAVFGVLLAFGMLFPNTSLYIMFIPIPIKAKYFVIGYGLVELFLGFANRAGDNIAHFAHIGGMLFGIIMILYWRKKDRKNGYYY